MTRSELLESLRSQRAACRGGDYDAVLAALEGPQSVTVSRVPLAHVVEVLIPSKGPKVAEQIILDFRSDTDAVRFEMTARGFLNWGEDQNE